MGLKWLLLTRWTNQFSRNAQQEIAGLGFRFAVLTVKTFWGSGYSVIKMKFSESKEETTCTPISCLISGLYHTLLLSFREIIQRKWRTKPAVKLRSKSCTRIWWEGGLSRIETRICEQNSPWFPAAYICKSTDMSLYYYYYYYYYLLFLWT
jgi:hypothetical protein